MSLLVGAVIAIILVVVFVLFDYSVTGAALQEGRVLLVDGHHLDLGGLQFVDGVDPEQRRQKRFFLPDLAWHQVVIRMMRPAKLKFIRR